MEYDLKKLTQEARDALNFLGESSHEYYFYYNFHDRTAVFSRNMWDRFALPPSREATCRLPSQGKLN